ncbi:hypothetical protein [Cyclobacterium qasimii]|nr:hypothetical protein [Cyclobacterium qasimii]
MDKILNIVLKLETPSKSTTPYSVTRPAFICNSFKDGLFLVMGEAYQIRDQEIEHDEIVLQRNDYRGEIPPRQTGASSDH